MKHFMQFSNPNNMPKQHEQRRAYWSVIAASLDAQVGVDEGWGL